MTAIWMQKKIALVLLGACAAVLVALTILFSAFEHRPELQQREAMLAIGAATFQWQIYHGDSICPSIRQLLEGKFLDPGVPKVDAWAQPFTITCMDDGAEVKSLGPDKKGGTSDDVMVFSPRVTPGKR